MNLKRTPLTILFLALLLTGFFRQKSESIDPFAKVTTVAESRGRDRELTVVSGAFVFDEFDVDNPVGRVPVPILGVFVENLAGLFADIFVLFNDDWEVEQESLSLEIPELDPDYFKELQLSNLDFSITSATNEKANLEFIENLTIYVANEDMHERGEKLMLARY